MHNSILTNLFRAQIDTRLRLMNSLSSNQINETLLARFWSAESMHSRYFLAEIMFVLWVQSSRDYCQRCDDYAMTFFRCIRWLRLTTRLNGLTIFFQKFLFNSKQISGSGLDFGEKFQLSSLSCQRSLPSRFFEHHFTPRKQLQFADN